MRTALLSLTIFAAGCGTAPAPEEKKAETPPPAILQFYASPGAIAKGDRSLLCYGVEGSASVRLDPAVEEITPSRARCVEVAPAASTKYTLYAKNAAGAEVSQQVEVVIDPNLKRTAVAPKRQGGIITFFSALPESVAPGQTVTLCYGVKGATSVSIAPAVEKLIPSEKLCFQTKATATTSYVLTAESASGEKDTETVRVTVR